MPEQQMRPFSSVDDAVRTRIFNEWRGQKAGAIQDKRDTVESDMGRAYEQAGPDLNLEKISSITGSLAEKAGKLVEIHSELSGLEDALKERKEMDDHARNIRNGNRGGGAADPQSQTQSVHLARPPTLADMVRGDFRAQGLEMGSREFAEAADKRGLVSRLSVRDNAILNTLFTTDAGWPPESVRDPGYTPSRRHPIQVIDILPRSSTTQELIKYMEETTYDNDAAAIAEGAASPESELALTEKEAAVRKLSTHIPVTREELEDEPMAESYLNETVPFMVRQAADKAVLDGDGTAPNMRGLLNVTGIQDHEFSHVSATNKNLSKPLNTLRKAKTKIRFGGRAMATHYIVNPNIWDDVVLSESSSGGYYYGSPQNNFVERAWGLPVVLSDHLSDATDENSVGAIVGDFSPMWIQLRMRRELETEWGYINDDFIKEIRRIKASIRSALVVKRPQAFAKITRPT